jgi:hypothetical protein
MSAPGIICLLKNGLLSIIYGNRFLPRGFFICQLKHCHAYPGHISLRSSRNFHVGTYHREKL